MKNTEFDPTNLRLLLEKSGLTYDEISEATGLSKATINHYANGIAPYSVNVLVTLADYFAVPTDYILGRCSKETAENISKDYSRHFMELRRAPYEAYLIGKRKGKKVPDCKGEAPWPYNLLEALSYPDDDPIDYLIKEDHEEYICEMLGKIEKRRAEIILFKFKDGLTYDEIGKIFNITGTRATQLAKKGIKNLWYEPLRNAILYGREYMGISRPHQKTMKKIE